MLKKTIAYTDYNGVERKQDYYFNLSKAELMEMEMGVQGGFTEMIQKIIATQDAPKLVAIFKDLLLKSYGEKSNDGTAFLKEDENGHLLANKFKQTEAYSILFMELATDADKAAEFVKGVIPSDLAEQVEANPAVLS